MQALAGNAKDMARNRNDGLREKTPTQFSGNLAGAASHRCAFIATQAGSLGQQRADSHKTERRKTIQA